MVPASIDQGATGFAGIASPCPFLAPAPLTHHMPCTPHVAAWLPFAADVPGASACWVRFDGINTTDAEAGDNHAHIDCGACHHAAAVAGEIAPARSRFLAAAPPGC